MEARRCNPCVGAVAAARRGLRRRCCCGRSSWRARSAAAAPASKKSSCVLGSASAAAATCCRRCRKACRNGGGSRKRVPAPNRAQRAFRKFWPFLRVAKVPICLPKLCLFCGPRAEQVDGSPSLSGWNTQFEPVHLLTARNPKSPIPLQNGPYHARGRHTLVTTPGASSDADAAGAAGE